MVQEAYRGARQWSRDRQAIAIVVWISFLAAAVGTMLFFAIFDPEQLFADMHLSRDAGYAVGFFFFWFLCAAASGLTAWLVRTAPKRDAKKAK